MTTPMSELETQLRQAFPQAVIEYAPPLQSTGPHYLCMRGLARFISVRWRGDLGFFVADPDDEDGAFDSVRGTTYASVAETCAQIDGLLAPQRSTAAR